MCLSLTHVISPVISCDLLNTKCSLQAFSALPSGSGPNVLCRYLQSHPRRASLPCVHIDCPCRQSRVAHVRAKLKCEHVIKRNKATSGMLSMLSRALNLNLISVRCTCCTSTSSKFWVQWVRPSYQCEQFSLMFEYSNLLIPEGLQHSIVAGGIWTRLHRVQVLSSCTCIA